MLSLTAEPVTALVDTAFIASLGVDPLAAVGVGATALSSLIWVFSFLGVGTQTEVAQAYGKGQTGETKRVASLAFLLAIIFGLLLTVLVWPASDWLAELLGAQGTVRELASVYMRIRVFGVPALLVMSVSFGVLRGVQDMRTPLWIAVGMNLLNLVLDWLLIFGVGPFPAMGVAGSALASTISQWVGALAGLIFVAFKTGLSRQVSFGEAARLVQVGGNLFLRTALVNVFLLYTTRVANQIGADAGAAHQVIRQVYVFTALAMDAFASTVQSLVGYFFGQGSVIWARRVARVGMWWSLGAGAVLGVLMWLGRGMVVELLVPAASVGDLLARLGNLICQPAGQFACFSYRWCTFGNRRLPLPAKCNAGGDRVGVAVIWLTGSVPGDGLSWIWIVYHGGCG